MNDIKTWQERAGLDRHDERPYMRAEIEELRAALAARATPAQPVPDAYVPIHPRTGPLWASTIPSKDCDHPANYELRPVYFAPSPASDVSAPSPSSVGAAIPDQKITDLANAHDCGRAPSGHRLFSDYNLMAFARAVLFEAAAIAEQVQRQQVPDLQRITDAIVSMREFYLGMLASSLRNDRADAFDRARHKDITKMVQEIVISELAAAPSIAQDGQKSESIPTDDSRADEDWFFSPNDE